MKLDFLPLANLTPSKANMRAGRRDPDVSDLLPSVRLRGILVPILVRPDAGGQLFEVVAGRRRHHCALLVAAERSAAGEAVEPMPCAIIEAGDDAAALEASLLENVARLDPDEVTRWEQFSRLVREGRTAEDISGMFALPLAMVRRILALGNLLPRIRDLYRRETIDVTTIRHLTMASKARQREWLALVDDPETRAPTGHALKAWLFGGASVETRHALFDLVSYPGAIVADLFGEGGYFADSGAFWAAQNAAIEERRQAFLDAGWADAVIVSPDAYFHHWEYEKTPKRKGGHVYIDVHSSGEVVIHEGYLGRRDAARAACGEERGTRPTRPELTAAMQTYVDLHRHAVVRAAMADRPAIALRLMVAHAVAGSPHWSVRHEPQAARSDAIRESVEASSAEALFDRNRRDILPLLGLDSETPTISRGHDDPSALVETFLRLLDMDDADVLRVAAIVMGETLAAGSPVIAALGLALGVDMADWWEADQAFLDLIRDREVLLRMLAETGGKAVAEAHAAEKTRTIKAVIADCLAGEGGRPRAVRWIPCWMAFPASDYTARGGVGSVAATEMVAGVAASLASPAGRQQADLSLAA